MDYIAKDTYTGRYSLRSSKVRRDTFTARELAAMGTVGEVMVLWEFSGHVRGVALYHRTRFVPQADGSLRGYSADGTASITHPADRRIEVMTR